MATIDTPRDPCAERAIAMAVARTLTHMSTDETIDTTATVTLAGRTPARERPVRLIQHPAFRRAADLGPDPRFTLAGRAPHRLEQVARAA